MAETGVNEICSLLINTNLYLNFWQLVSGLAGAEHSLTHSAVQLTSTFNVSCCRQQHSQTSAFLILEGTLVRPVFSQTVKAAGSVFKCQCKSL